MNGTQDHPNASPRFARDLDAHVRAEFPKLRDLLADMPGGLTGVRP